MIPRPITIFHHLVPSFAFPDMQDDFFKWTMILLTVIGCHKIIGEQKGRKKGNVMALAKKTAHPEYGVRNRNTALKKVYSNEFLTSKCFTTNDRDAVGIVSIISSFSFFLALDIKMKYFVTFSEALPTNVKRLKFFIS